MLQAVYTYLRLTRTSTRKHCLYCFRSLALLLSRSLTLSLSSSLALSPSCFLALLLSRSLALSLSHSLALALPRSLALSLPHFALPRSFALSLPHFVAPSLSRSLTLLFSCSLALPLFKPPAAHTLNRIFYPQRHTTATAGGLFQTAHTADYVHVGQSAQLPPKCRRYY